MEAIRNHFSIRRYRRVCFWLSFVPAGFVYYLFAAAMFSPGQRGQAIVIGILFTFAVFSLLVQVILAAFSFAMLQK